MMMFKKLKNNMLNEYLIIHKLVHIILAVLKLYNVNLLCGKKKHLTVSNSSNKEMKTKFAIKNFDN